MIKTVVGREIELTAIDRFLEGLRNGSATMLIEGTAGIGKTTILQTAVRRADELGARILFSRPGPSETRLTYAGLLDLLEAVEDDVFVALPVPQRRALEAALLRADAEGPSADQRSIATGFLSVLRTLSISKPVVLVIDDVQWLDGPSRHVLEFAMRRLESERIGLIAAARLDAHAPSRAPFGQSLATERVRQIKLGPLTVAALHDIIRAELGHTFARPTLVRIERTSAGNPFFALELARAILDSGESSSGSALLAVPNDLVELLTRRLRRMPSATERTLLVAAALSQPTLDMLDAKALLRAEAAGIVDVDERGRVTFSHPLLASAVYGAAHVDRRRQVHRELAARATTSEERAKHLALATDGPDEEVAAALVEAARSARGRGAPDAAIELIELACELTPGKDRETLFVRRLELGRSLAGAGDPHRAMSVLRALAEEAPPGLVRARSLLLLGFLSEWADGSVVATRICEEALIAAGQDVELRAEIHAAASRICDHDVERKRSHARAALDLTERGSAGSRLRAYALLAFAEAEFKAGRGILHDVFKEASRLELAEEQTDPVRIAQRSHTVHLYSDIRPSDRLLGILRVYADEIGPARAVLERERRAVTEHGDEAQLARTLGRLAAVELRAGNWDLAERHIGEMSKVAERTGEGVVAHRRLILGAELAALRGELATARQLAGAALMMAESAEWPWETAQTLATLGFLDLADGDANSAMERLDRVDQSYRSMGFGDPGLFRHQADHVEALIASGKLGLADQALKRFEGQGLATGRAWALAAAARCRGLLCSAAGDLAGSLRALDTAVVTLETVEIPFELARTLLIKGQVHRRRKEKLLARKDFVKVVEILDRLGSRLWADRARAELGRVGSPKSDRHELTVTEERVASLAASGLTNRVIAERAFLSPKTVESNLARVYQKLGINSRAQLGRAMAERERAAAK